MKIERHDEEESDKVVMVTGDKNDNSADNDNID